VALLPAVSATLIPFTAKPWPTFNFNTLDRPWKLHSKLDNTVLIAEGNGLLLCKQWSWMLETSVIIYLLIYSSKFFYRFFHGATVPTGLLSIKTSRSLSDTQHSVENLWASYRPVAVTSSWQRTTHRTEPCRIHTRNTSKQEAAYPCLRQQDHLDRPCKGSLLNIDSPPKCAVTSKNWTVFLSASPNSACLHCPSGCF
jgi:hypothetical protein